MKKAAAPKKRSKATKMASFDEEEMERERERERELATPSTPKSVTKRERNVKKTTVKGSDKTMRPNHPPEVVKNATDFVKWAHDLGVDGLVAFWHSDLANKNPPTAPAPSYEANKEKNRYQDVICLEESRIKLVKDNPTDGDYIHANYVRFPGYDRTYLCTQGPLENTIEDFWRLVWQEKVPIIVNLTACCETAATGERKAKCAEYWALKEGESKTCGRFNVLTKKKEKIGASKLDSYVIEVLPEGCSDSLIVRLLHSGVWPDGGVMNKPLLVLRIIKQIYNSDTLATGNILIHCSAGIGRTGTMVLIDYLLYRIFTQRLPANLPEAFGQLRQQRASAVQTPSQFVYIVLTVSCYIALSLKDDVLKGMCDKLDEGFTKKDFGKAQQ